MNHLSSILNDKRLTRPNLSDWLHNLNNVMNIESITYILETKPVLALGVEVTDEELSNYELWHANDLKVRCYMLASMSDKLQRQHENMKSAREVLKQLKELYGENSITSRYEISKELFRARMLERADVTSLSTMANKRKDQDVILVTEASTTRVSKQMGKKKKGAVEKGTCFYCGKDGHWKRSYPHCLESLKAIKRKKPSEGTSKQ
ncbi:hypothetical protein CRG98_003630 [Punica granatum]|uniref:CCHC-type domain-containing protein n=1 Tax=Punica granatum TaxID=22663 RepID=A0A2I0L5K3_PUNGR|nr:hypothetical protein CRG98_003630 [Punica granatum]